MRVSRLQIEFQFLRLGFEFERLLVGGLMLGGQSADLGLLEPDALGGRFELRQRGPIGLVCEEEFD
ncbi:MAG: hypothetical protein QM770_09565 [Tepidisphaeraceae bacterium]